MSNKILIRRGLEANLPSSGLTVGEPFFTTDTNRFFIAKSTTELVEYVLSDDLGTAAFADTGTGSGNVPVLDTNGKLNTSVLPAIAITDVFVVASEEDQLALEAEEGDIAIRTDESKSYIHNGGTAGTMADWTLLLVPTDTVLSVNGQTGTVVLDADDISDSTTTNKWTSTAEKTLWNTVSNKVETTMSGEASITNSAIALFDGTDGLKIKDSGKTIAESVGNDHTTVPTSLAVKLATIDGGTF